MSNSVKYIKINLYKIINCLLDKDKFSEEFFRKAKNTLKSKKFGKL